MRVEENLNNKTIDSHLKYFKAKTIFIIVQKKRSRKYYSTSAPQIIKHRFKKHNKYISKSSLNIQIQAIKVFVCVCLCFFRIKYCLSLTGCPKYLKTRDFRGSKA